MTFIITLLYFFIVLGVTVLIHEFGHYLFAKKAGIYVYEFSIGMGPRLFKWKRKNDETEYSIRLLPIGGYVAMAGEQIEVDEEIPIEKRMQSKTWLQRFMTVIAGVLFNFVLAVVVFFIVAFIMGAPQQKPYVGEVTKNDPAYMAGLETGDLITKVGKRKVSSNDLFLLEYQVNIGKPIELTVKKADGSIKVLTINPRVEKKEDTEVYHYGFGLSSERKHGIWASLKYAFTYVFQLIQQMIFVLWYLITGKLGLNSLSGPVGIFNIVGQSAKAGFINVVYLLGFISANVGFMNLLPIPAFDGGRLLFMVIEKIKGSPVNPKVENTIHTVGLALLMILMLYITFNDIIRIW